MEAIRLGFLLGRKLGVTLDSLSVVIVVNSDVSFCPWVVRACYLKYKNLLFQEKDVTYVS